MCAVSFKTLTFRHKLVESCIGAGRGSLGAMRVDGVVALAPARQWVDHAAGVGLLDPSGVPCLGGAACERSYACSCQWP